MVASLQPQTWSDWVPLPDTARRLARDPGIYRIRRAGDDELVYVGQTGRSLAERLGAIKFDAPKMPYRDPHTAAPALWALRHRDGCSYEASVSIVHGDAAVRKAIECVVLAQHRQEHGRSPAANFGRMPAGYAPSSPRNARVIATGKLRVGGPDPNVLECHEPGIAPRGPLDTDVTGARWCGLRWGAWMPLVEALDDATIGFYRIAVPDEGQLIYVGESARVGARLRDHAAKAKGSGRQAEMFGRSLVISIAAGPALAHQRLEVETDLIAAHVLATSRPPSAQFIG